MLVRALMTGAPITLPPDISIFEARRLMDGERIRHVLVTLGGDLLGIITDRDIRLNMPSPATTLSVWELNYLLARLTVGEVMTKSVIVVGLAAGCARGRGGILLVRRRSARCPCSRARPWWAS